MFSQIFLASPIWVKKTYGLSNLSCSVSPIWGGMFSNFENFPLHMGGDVFAKITLPHGENPRRGNFFVSPMGKIVGGELSKKCPPPYGGGTTPMTRMYYAQRLLENNLGILRYKGNLKTQL